MSTRALDRRDFLRSGLIAVAATIVGPAAWRPALLRAQASGAPYGGLQPPDPNGLMLPRGFSSRVVARSRQRVAGSGYAWHDYPDGGATFPRTDGGWIYVSNSEVSGRGGAGALRFDRDGDIVDAYRILGGTSSNCAGGPTPWGTWLSCEEMERGRVWECDPAGERRAVVRPALGTFWHEAAAVDPVGEHLYLTEDAPDGRFYRFTPAAYPNLDTGIMEVVRVENLREVLAGGSSTVSWRRIPDPTAGETPTRRQVSGSTRFHGGEGCWYDDGVVYFTTKGDGRVWAYRTTEARIELLYDAARFRRPVLTGVDNVFVSERSGDVFVAEDGGDLDVVMITPDRSVARLVKATGAAHRGSEITGPALNPSGDRFYFSSQRGFRWGVTYEIRGPFRGAQATPTTPPPPTAEPTNQPAAQPSPDRAEDDIWGGVATGIAALTGAAAAALGARGYRRRRQRDRASGGDAR